MKTPTSNIKVAISWSGIPAYGARLMRAGIGKFGCPVAVIGTLPEIPVKGLEEIIGQKIYWVDKLNVKSWQDLDLPVPDIFFQAGWFIPSFNKLGEEVRNNGGKVIGLIDNSRKNSLRQWLGAAQYRLRYRKWFSAVWVPGKSGTQLLRFFGVPSSQIYQGLYGSDPDCFTPGPFLTKRPKQFVFIGQFIPRKGVPTLIKAFEAFHPYFPDWKMLVYGAGECLDILKDCRGIEVHPFEQAPQIAEVLRRSRFLVLPSREDHWPLVVSEAAMSGCGLILSDKVGNRHEFLNEKNGFLFPAGSVKELAVKLKEAASLSERRLDEAYAESKLLGSLYGPAHWAEVFQRIISEVGPGGLRPSESR